VEKRVGDPSIEEEENRLLRQKPPSRRKKKSPEPEIQELDALAASERREPLPEPEEVVKDIGLLVERYGIGTDPDFCLEIHRINPKYHGSHQIGGFLEAVEAPIDRGYIQDKYGGGTYRVVAKGPGKSGARNKWYASCTENISGEPRLTRSAYGEPGRDGGVLGGDPSRTGTGPLAEPPSIVLQAFKTISDGAKDERDKRDGLERELRERLTSGGTEQATMINLMKEVYEGRAKDSSDQLEARLERERQVADDRLKERDVQLDDIRRELRSGGNNNIAETIREILPHVKSDGDAAKQWLDSVLAKHRDELQAVRDSYAREVDSIRAAHQRELEATRDAHARGLEAEREAGRNREQRSQDIIDRERDERKRDHDQHKRYIDDIEIRWKERLENQRQMDGAHAESRFETMRNGLETQNQYLRDELDRVRREVEDIRTKQQDAGDPESQIQKARALLEMSKDLAGGSGGGIAEAIGGWDGFLKGVGDRFPEVLHAIGNAVTGRPAVGGGGPQMVMTPQGPMIQTPQGLVPPRGAPPPMLGGGGGAAAAPPRRRRRVMPDLDELYSEREMETEPRRVPDDRDERPRYRPTRERMTTQGAREERGPVEARDVAPERPPAARITKQDATILSKMIDDAIERGYEPEQFIDEIAKDAPPPMMKAIASLSSEEVLAAFEEHAPDTTALTPGGKKFVRGALREIRDRVG
jgi:hypothetical protein